MAIDPAAAAADEPLLFPVGHYVGLQYGGTDPDSVAPHQVRRGAVFHSLTDQQYVAWTLGHGTPDAVTNEVPWHRRSVEDIARAGGITPVAGLVDDLVELGLLVEVGPGTAQALDFAKLHRIVPLMLGLGHTAEEPDLFGIGFLGQPVLQVSHSIYDLWQWSTMDDSLWSTCESAADVARRAGWADTRYTEPELLLTGFLGSLHALLVSGAACVDIDVHLGPVS